MSIPEELAKIIDIVIQEKKYGYRNRQDFVIDAIRLRLRQLGYLP